MNRDWDKFLTEVMEEQNIRAMEMQIKEREYNQEASMYSRLRDNREVSEWRRYNV